MGESLNSKVEDAMKKAKSAVKLDRIYTDVATATGLSDDPEFKRKVRRALYHLGQAGKVSRTGPSTYKHTG